MTTEPAAELFDLAAKVVVAWKHDDYVREDDEYSTINSWESLSDAIHALRIHLKDRGFEFPVETLSPTCIKAMEDEGDHEYCDGYLPTDPEAPCLCECHKAVAE